MQQVFITLAGGVGDIIHEDFGGPLKVVSKQTREEMDALITQAEAVVKEMISAGAARFGRVRVRSVSDPLPPSGSLVWHYRDDRGRPAL